MLRYLIRRLLWAVLLFVAVTIVTYIIFYAIPADPARLACGQRATPECIKRAAHYLGTDRPLYFQYYKFFGRLMPFSFRGGPHLKEPRLGRSFTNRQSVNSVVAHAAPVTASLVFGGAVFWMLIALPVGILSALRPRSLLDRIAMVFVLVGISAHPVWIGLLFAYFFGFKAGLFPITGYSDFFAHSGDTSAGPVQWAYHLVLPWATFAILFAALYVRMIRANVMETLNEDYVRTARAKGAPEWLVMRSHVLRNALLPVVTMLGMDIGIALGGAIFTESVYGLPGLGKTAITAIDSFDLPTTQGVVVFATLVIIVFNLIIDLLYAVIDPRIRLS
ncbi:MAG: ABC transporter permease [Actinobacteria bacterium]|nr:ABC transporter permease [Actinomycetota bacterium]